MGKKGGKGRKSITTYTRREKRAQGRPARMIIKKRKGEAQRGLARGRGEGGGGKDEGKRGKRNIEFMRYSGGKNERGREEGKSFDASAFMYVPVQPAFVRVIDENSKNTLSTGATLGPINEGSAISLYCESGEGKPVPTVEWFKGDQLLEGKIRAILLFVRFRDFIYHKFIRTWRVCRSGNISANGFITVR
jgi:hypothetical protein